MGATWSKRLRPAMGWLAMSLSAPVLAQDLPPLPGESGSAVHEPAITPESTIPTGSVKGWANALLKETETLRIKRNHDSRFWFLDAPAPQAPFRLNPGVDFVTESTEPIPSVSKAESRSSKTEPPALANDPTPPADPLPSATELDPAAVLAETRGRLDRLAGDRSGEATPATNALLALLRERLKLLKEWDEVVKDRLAVENSGGSPEKESADCKADLERIKATLDQTARDPDALLPVSFRKADAHLPEPVRAELKEAIDAARVESKDWSARLEAFLADTSRKAGAAPASARARRDKTQRQLTGLMARNAQREAALASARTPEARELARESLVNGHWETRIEAERLRGQEAQVAMESRRSDLSALKLQALESHAQLVRRTLDRLTQRYQALATIEERDLHRAAVKEETRAEHSNDPLERYRARRTSELLELEARVVTNENALTTNPPPTYDQQHDLAERARIDFDASKKLLADGKISHLDALRLNTDFRRIGSVRARIVRGDLAVTSDRLTRAENALGAVETELAYDSRDDRFELDNLLEHLPPADHPKAETLFKEFEARHLALLNRRRAALDRIAQRVEETHKEVLRRLAILDDHFGFIRTHMFWVRDEEPVGEATLAQAQRELKQLGRASIRIGAEVGDRSAWGRLSAEFLAASAGLIILPWPLRRAHRAMQAGSVPATRTEGPPAP